MITDYDCDENDHIHNIKSIRVQREVLEVNHFAVDVYLKICLKNGISVDNVVHYQDKINKKIKQKWSLILSYITF